MHITTTAWSAATPVVLWDVDGVLNPHVPTRAHLPHAYHGPGPTGGHVAGMVFLNPQHGQWMAELTAAGAAHAWATNWGQHATEWIAGRVGYSPAADWPVIDVGVHGGVMFGHTRKLGPVSTWLGADRPAFWLDDTFGGKDGHWAEDRTARGVPTVVRHVASPAGLARADIDAALAWLRHAANLDPHPGAHRDGVPHSHPDDKDHPSC